ncbi:hypothetical protein ABPG73_008055 [Tetrahymena malaccensis]
MEKIQKNETQSKGKDYLQYYQKNQVQSIRDQFDQNLQSQPISHNTIQTQNNIMNLKSQPIIKNILNEISFKIRFKKYASIFLQFARKRMFRLLNGKQIEMINDKSYFKEEKMYSIQANQMQGLRRLSVNSKVYNLIYQNQNGKKRDKEKSKLECIYQQIPIFLPHTKFIEFWQAIKIFATLICFFCYLVCFSFESLISQLFRIEFIIFCQLLTFLDIFIHTNTAIYVKGVLCTNRQAIFKYYRESNAFLYDFISQFFPLSYFLITQDNWQSRIALVLLLPIVFKYKDINIIINNMKDKFLFDKKAQNIIELINLFKNVILISHIFACIWILAAKISYLVYNIPQLQQQPSNLSNNYNTQTWIDMMQLTDSSWIVQYIYSYYFITVTMATVGYGDIKPTNVIEIIVCTALMMICCAIFAFTINSIGQIFQDFYQKENMIREKRFIIGNYMIKKGVSKSTMKDVYEYLEYYWKERSDENLQEENHIISQLSNGLREELLAESNRIIFKDCSFFKDNFSYETLLRCLPIIQEQRCTPEEVIYDSEIGDSDIWLYFIQEGELELFIQSPDYTNKRKIQFQNSAITIIKQGDQFGEVQFFTGEQPKMSLKSLNFSKY